MLRPLFVKGSRYSNSIFFRAKAIAIIIWLTNLLYLYIIINVSYSHGFIVVLSPYVDSSLEDICFQSRCLWSLRPSGIQAWCWSDWHSHRRDSEEDDVFLIAIFWLDRPKYPLFALLHFTLATFLSPTLQAYSRFLVVSFAFLWLKSILGLFRLCCDIWSLPVAEFQDLKMIFLNSLIISHKAPSLVSSFTFFTSCFQRSELLCFSSNIHQAHQLTVLLF